MISTKRRALALAIPLALLVLNRYVTLGTDGYGRSDGRAALRNFFEVDRNYIVVAALNALADDGAVSHEVVATAIRKFGIDPEKPDPVTL